MLCPEPGAVMRRREFIRLLSGAAVAWPLATRAQQTARVPRIGYLAPTSDAGALNDSFRQGLRELGYEEGNNIVIEYRSAEGRFDRLRDLAAELVALKVDVIVAVVTQASLAAKDATTTIPIVMAAVSDPLGSGLVTSLQRPSANITGTGSMTSEVVGKSLQLLKETVPNLSRVAVLWNPDNAVFQAQMLKEADRAAGVLGLELKTFGARNVAEIDRAFTAITGENVGALLVLNDPTLIRHRAQIVTLVQRNRLPAVSGQREFAVAGGLMAYGTDIQILFRRAAVYVDKILKGAKPSDLPVELPTKFELIINLKSAEALGLTFPLALLGRADEVIE
jgi:putative ABC transport system substrate-binding protein